MSISHTGWQDMVLSCSPCLGALSDRGANPGDLGPPELSQLEFVHELIARLCFVCVPGSVGDESTKQMLSLPHVSQGFSLEWQTDSMVEAGWERERAIATRGWGPHPGSTIYQPTGFM